MMADRIMRSCDRIMRSQGWVMLEALLGSDDAARVLLFIGERGRGYGREIAGFWSSSLSGTQRQLDKLEAGGVLAAESVGRTRVYSINSRCPYRDELRALLATAIRLLPDRDRERLQRDRRRPRRRGKPL